MPPATMRTIRVHPGRFVLPGRPLCGVPQHAPYTLYSEGRAEIAQFMNAVKALQSQDMVIELQWGLWWYRKFRLVLVTWSSSEKTLLDLVGADWNGRFRKVQIYFTYYSKEDDEYRRMLDFGRGGRETW
jgi:hypothetical protein